MKKFFENAVELMQDVPGGGNAPQIGGSEGSLGGEYKTFGGGVSVDNGGGGTCFKPALGGGI